MWLLLLVAIIMIIANSYKYKKESHTEYVESFKQTTSNEDDNKFSNMEFGREELIKKDVARRLVKVYSNRPYVYYKKVGSKIKIDELRNMGLPEIVVYGLIMDEAVMRRVNRVDMAAAPEFADGKMDSTISRNLFRLEDGKKVVGRERNDHVADKTIYYYVDYDNVENNIGDDEKSLFIEDGNITYGVVKEQKTGKKLEPFDKIRLNGITQSSYESMDLIEVSYYIKLEHFGNSSNIKEITDIFVGKNSFTDAKYGVRVDGLRWNEVYRLILVLATLGNVSRVELKN